VVLVVVPGNGTTSLESAYSSLSRGREEIHVFADTTSHGPDPMARLAARWGAPEPKRTATARAREWAADMGDQAPASRSQDGPATRRQMGYLAGLAARAGEQAPTALTRRQATAAITELQQRIGRPAPAWASELVSAGELARPASQPLLTAGRDAAPDSEVSLPHRRPPPVRHRVVTAQPLQRAGADREAVQGDHDVSGREAGRDPLDVRAEQTFAAAMAARQRAIDSVLRRDPSGTDEALEAEQGLSRQRALSPPWQRDLGMGL
jgi:Protein of unknown function (DUF3072)